MPLCVGLLCGSVCVLLDVDHALHFVWGLHIELPFNVLGVGQNRVLHSWYFIAALFIGGYSVARAGRLLAELVLNAVFNPKQK